MTTANQFQVLLCKSVFKRQSGCCV